ncbi:TBC1 domain family member 14 [Rhizoctonia solani]|uniref:TBC1 domain family member 14 n=1 Tax=Rhizoctonia solani TaxID=456999 RepID=A0A8H8NZ16_9AGAM|nr:TBC1 domain family member 14 [Rhizoctonia solani]QRW22150.1 TBC1 domain family member 14 [Rhizoctonia solani]
MSSPHSPVSEHERRSTDSDKQPHQADGLHRSHHIDSGLDVSEDANQGKHEPIMPTPRMRSFRSYDRQESAKPSPSTVSIPVSVTPEKEYAYAEESVGTSSPTPKPYTKPTVIPVSVALTVNTDVGPESGIESPSQTDSAAPKTPTPDSAPPTTPVPNEPTTSGSSPQKPPKAHRYVKSAGPSMLEKVISKTRPTHLPPKNKLEDVKHLKEYEEMMERSRAAEQQKKHELEQRRLARERAVEDSLHIWKREVVPNWKEAIRKPYIRQMWWRGIPTRLRGEMWIKAIGNGLAISKDSYKRCLARANRALTSGSFPVETLAIIEEDIRVTLPGLHIFHPETGPLYSDLKDLLCAWVVSRSDEGLGYVKGVSSMAGMFLINMSSDDAFVCMRNLLERHCMRSFYGGPSAKDDIEAYYRIFDTLLADGVPKVFFNFKQHQISPSQYLPDWILPMFLHHLPFEACARIWDVIILEGDSFLYRAALAIIAVIEPRLFFPDRKELMEVLRGENRAALEVAKRSGLQVDQSARYEQYGMNEEVLWAEIMGMDEWWKDSTWSRLIQRELPDV